MKWLEKYADYAYALMRIVTGFVFSFHGPQIILGVPSEFRAPAWSQLWFGGIIELVGGLMVMLGFKTRAAAFLCCGTMAVAYIQRGKRSSPVFQNNLGHGSPFYLNRAVASGRFSTSP